MMGYDLGDTVPITGMVRDAAGAPTNASTVELTVRLPDGTQTSPSVLNPPAVTGTYTYDYVPAVDGHFQWWLRTTGPSTGLTGSFDVAAAFPALLISLELAREQVNAKTRVSDEDLRDLVMAATEALEGPDFAGHAIVRRTVTEQIDVTFGEAFYLTEFPVISVASVVSAAGGSWNPSTQLQVDRDTGQVQLIYGPPLYGRVTVVYDVGYTAIPPKFRMAGRLLVQDLWATQSTRYGRDTGYGRQGGGGDVADQVSPHAASQVRALLGAPWVLLGSP